MKIAVDGPSAAGKSTVCGLLSQKLGILYLDTGAMYRAVALQAYRMGMCTDGFPMSDDKSIGALLACISIDVRYIAGGQRVFLDGKDVSEEIRQHFVSKLASDISAVPKVRLFLVGLQREIARRQDCVLDGRDIGTYVLPDAEFKFYLSADLDERARRRCEELRQKGQDCEQKQVKEDIKKRDCNDMNRAFAPLKKAEGAIEIDSTFLTAEQVAEKIVNVIMAAHKKKQDGCK